jgi:hypothetical protein
MIEDIFRCEACRKDFPESEIGEVYDPVNGGLFCETCSTEWIAEMNACDHKWDGDATIERSCEKCGKYEAAENIKVIT